MYNSLYHPPTQVEPVSGTGLFCGCSDNPSVATSIQIVTDRWLLNGDIKVLTEAPTQSKASATDKNRKTVTLKCTLALRKGKNIIIHITGLSGAGWWKWKLPKFKINICEGKKHKTPDTQRGVCYTPEQMWGSLFCFFVLKSGAVTPLMFHNKGEAGYVRAICFIFLSVCPNY